MFFNKQIFSYTITTQFKIPPSHKSLKVLLRHLPLLKGSSRTGAVEYVLKGENVIPVPPNLQRRISEGSAKESRRAGAAEYVTKDNPNSKFKIQNSKFPSI